MEKDACCMKLESLLDEAICDFDRNSDALNIAELGEAADIIKDIAEAKKSLLEARYYESIVEAMENRDEPYGYRPIVPDEQAWIRNADSFIDRMGYPMHSTPISNDTAHMRNRYGTAYQNYSTARKHYTQTHDKADKDDMDHGTREHIMDTVVTMKEMWLDADPILRQEMKEKLQQLINEMK